MRKLRIDVETYSPVDLKKCGARKYVEHPDFEIILLSYKWIVNGYPLPTVCVDLANGEEIPDEVFDALTDPSVKKTAFNAAFEILTIGKHYGIELDRRQWECTMVHALYLGLPGSLAEVGNVMKAKVRKDFAGSSLIRVFCVPCKPTKKNGQRTRNLPEHDPERWAKFKHYNIIDVESEHEIAVRLERHPVPDIEWHRWCLDEAMNDAGVQVDLPLIDAAIELDARLRAEMNAEAVKLTGLQNPNSVKQLLKWLNEELEDHLMPDQEITKLNKTTMPRIANFVAGVVRPEDTQTADRVDRLLEIRKTLAKASVSKYHAMRRAATEKSRVHGVTQFYGANRTGRAAGRLVQLQNLRSNTLPSSFKDPSHPNADEKGMVEFDQLALARRLLRNRDFESLLMLWDNPMDILSQLVRTALVADDGHVFAPVDFSAIEARWLAWYAGEEWRLEVFRTHGKIYEASASQMFGIPIEKIGKNSIERKKGKVAELALGYQGGPAALERMGALDKGTGLQYSDLKPLVDLWRESNLKIAGRSYKGEEPGVWEEIEDAAIQCISTGKPVDVRHGVRFRIDAKILFLRLPSGRELAYCKPHLEEGAYGPQAAFFGRNQVTGRWEQQTSYGGRWIENIDQANCRDLLYHKLGRLEDVGLHTNMRFHVHDEAVPSIPLTGAPDTLKRIMDIFGEPVEWAPGLPLRGDGFLTPFFRKDD